MSNEKLSNVSDMVTYTNSFFNSIRKTSHRSLILLVELGLITAMIALVSVQNTVAIGILVIAGVGVAMNLYTIDAYNRDYAEFQSLCESFTDHYRSTGRDLTAMEVTEDINELRRATERYMNKYKLVSVINTLTLAVVAVSVCLIITAII